MKKETIFLRITIYVFALIMAAICIIVAPHYIIGANNLMPNKPILTIIFGVGLYATAILFYLVLYQAMKLLNLIDHNSAFSNKAVIALKTIKIYAYIMCAIYILESPVFFVFADRDDAPGVILVCAVLAGASLVIAIFASMLQKLLHHAIEIKSENDLTI
ncbi:DUF2975 domain-containing protein [Companilactobacillus allii]|uniref:DUF2975 domain-containing protein n=1 Tax=Companilactobacillus allii TaxID=1847728 RepID=A0A1P8Q0U8_9LACO|nr:DUF2975 domain-containing protein [Companilactobacillus allii]APX71490.1 hypothetical protein BTM29_02480 [Companilactobacillus allii]USQ68571.1 DUF2975 domain-containing protein [Companilactobacillus allii]